MNINCRKCNATISEEAAFCSACGAVVGAKFDTQTGGEDGSWDIPVTFVGTKRPALPSRSEQTNEPTPVAHMPHAKDTPSTSNEE